MPKKSFQLLLLKWSWQAFHRQGNIEPGQSWSWQACPSIILGVEPLTQLCQKGLLCSKSPMCTLSQNGYGANLLPLQLQCCKHGIHRDKKVLTHARKIGFGWDLVKLLHNPATQGLTKNQHALLEQSKKQSWAHSCYQRSLTPIQAHSLPSACRAESCLLCCQPEPSLSHYLPDYHRLLHDSLADCKLKGDELSTWVSGHSNNSCTPLPSSKCDREMHPQHKSAKPFFASASLLPSSAPLLFIHLPQAICFHPLIANLPG